MSVWTPTEIEAYQQEGSQGVRDDLVQQHLYLVKRAASRIRSTLPRTVEGDDLIGYGLLGLLEAAERFDASRGVPFSGFALRRIQGAIIDGLRQMGWLPRGMYQRAKKLTEALAVLEERLSRPPSEEEVAEHLHVSLTEYQAMVLEAAPVTLLPLDEVIQHQSESAEQEDWMQAEKEELQQAIARGIDTLPEKERLVVSLYFHEEMSLKEIAAVLEVTEGRACQLKTQAMLRLQAFLIKQGW